MTISETVLKRAKDAAADIEADVYFYNGPVLAARDLEVIESVQKHHFSKKALLLLVTNGGDPDAGYKISRFFQEKYEYFTVLISGRCKSAGTLIALGANEIAFAPYGELGPLDIQMSKIDRFDQMQSGLTIQDSLNTLEARALEAFYKVVQEYIHANNGLLSFSSASKAASDFVTQLYAPVFSRIDPEEVGAKARSMRIAIDYGQRLSVKSQNVKSGTLKLLAETYSSHSFVIDKQEAETLFERVRSATDAEAALVAALGRHARFEAARPSDFVFSALSETQMVNHKGARDDQADRSGNPAQDGRDSSRTNGQAGPAPRKQKRGVKRAVPVALEGSPSS